MRSPLLVSSNNVVDAGRDPETPLVGGCLGTPLLVKNNDGGWDGRDPETITVGEWLETPHGKKNPYAVMREKCLDCCCGLIVEVRLCPAVDCALWPYRMTSNPFRPAPSDKQKANGVRAANARLVKMEGE